jgi:hypothetical protein
MCRVVAVRDDDADQPPTLVVEDLSGTATSEQVALAEILDGPVVLLAPRRWACPGPFLLSSARLTAIYGQLLHGDVDAVCAEMSSETAGGGPASACSHPSTTGRVGRKAPPPAAVAVSRA